MKNMTLTETVADHMVDYFANGAYICGEDLHYTFPQFFHHQPNAVGPVIRGLVTMGLLKPTGKYINQSRRPAKGRINPVYQVSYQS